MATNKPSLYGNDNGMICCIEHGGSYLRSAYEAAPERQVYNTPLDRWQMIDPEYVADWTLEMGTPPTCEVCYC